MKKIILISLLFTGFTLADGGALFSKCSGCHGQDGEKAALGKSAELKGMSKDSILSSLKAYKKGELNKYGMGSLMKVQVASLSDKDIDELATYISEFK
jgi:cytochrome c553